MNQTGQNREIEENGGTRAAAVGAGLTTAGTEGDYHTRLSLIPFPL